MRKKNEGQHKRQQIKPSTKVSSQGMVYVFTGEGKGKTSAALGVCVRALANGWRVGWVSWYKSADWKINEAKLPQMLKRAYAKNLQFFQMGKGFYLKDTRAQRTTSRVKTQHVNDAIVVDSFSPEQHKDYAHQALACATDLLSHVDVLLLDEVCNAIQDGLVEEKEILALMERRGSTHVVLTGRGCGEHIQSMSDLVTEMQKRKHPFDQGNNAVAGLDF